MKDYKMVEQVWKEFQKYNDIRKPANTYAKILVAAAKLNNVALVKQIKQEMLENVIGAMLLLIGYRDLLH
jgi:hypothetical protein